MAKKKTKEKKVIKVSKGTVEESTVEGTIDALKRLLAIHKEYYPQ